MVINQDLGRRIVRGKKFLLSNVDHVMVSLLVRSAAIIRVLTLSEENESKIKMMVDSFKPNAISSDDDYIHHSCNLVSH